jgi:hypothetical protein
MPKTAYSQYYKTELDVEQLLAKIKGVSLPAVAQDLAALPAATRDWIRGDIICASCGRGGAQLVAAAMGKRAGTSLRQAHFRFVDPDGRESHHPYCEFNRDDGAASLATGLVDFAESKSRETRIVRELVCKGIEHGVFSQESIRQMRQWFFDTKVTSRFVVRIRNEDIEWLQALRSHHFSGLAFQASHGQMPEYDWKTAAKVAFTEQYSHLIARARSVPISKSTRLSTGRLVKKWHGQEVFDVTVLEPAYRQCLSLAEFMARNMATLGYDAGRLARLHYDAVTAPLLAFCALLLFISGWDFELAVSRLAYLANAPAPNDLSLGNVMGLNPFHDYLAWRVIVLAGQLADERPKGVTYSTEIGEFEGRLRQAHMNWKAAQA